MVVGGGTQETGSMKSFAIRDQRNFGDFKFMSGLENILIHSAVIIEYSRHRLNTQLMLTGASEHYLLFFPA